MVDKLQYVRVKNRGIKITFREGDSEMEIWLSAGQFLTILKKSPELLRTLESQLGEGHNFPGIIPKLLRNTKKKNRSE